MARPMSAGHPGSSMEKLEDSDSLLAMGYPELHRNSAVRTDQSLPPLPHARLVDNGVIPTRRQRSYAPASLGHGPGSRRSNTDWLADEKPTVGKRLQPTLDVAKAKRDTYAAKAKSTGWTLNAAIGLQVLFGSITTGLSAVGTTGRSTAVQTTIFGAMSTLVASYLAKARGSKEPELSIVRTRDLEHFIREIEAFMLDHGHVDTDVWDKDINRFRLQLEGILSNADDKGLKAASTA
ncbi:hypothetical protein AGABI2DRAFT_135041 [Agaricus bisporus var. bisporus H97]|uniref:hypothetical protein n=1 Tax=Agaricus bisporus var. bisporus (strain H97 / ATCC MYA-4626 / FGSC 10389) TaxID=936046 RepID=UPI00029F5706|nr:hypothetical protein AGABI2DRAFT_135041 [Agaricus bisporus var. bisporus H97]EKV49604.1 hypothetical protein AGABI2DRAFT_135041 [Agaricus bisporus var. bisporus H97]